MSVPDNENLGNAVVMADGEGACRDPDYLSPPASAPTSEPESECDVGEASSTSTEYESDISSDSQDEPYPWEDAFDDAAATRGVQIPRDDEEDTSVECEDHFEELNSFAMASQGNLHTMAVFPRPGYGNTGSNLLVATLSRQIYTMGFAEYDPQKSKMEDLRYLATYVL